MDRPPVSRVRGAVLQQDFAAEVSGAMRIPWTNPRTVPYSKPSTLPRTAEAKVMCTATSRRLTLRLDSFPHLNTIRHYLEGIRICFFLAVVGCGTKTPETGLTPGLEEGPLIELHKQISPAVVTIFSLNNQGQRVGLGSGFFISPDGVIATNNHVIEDAKKLKARSSNGSFFDIANVISTSPDADLALLKVDAIDVSYLELGESEAVSPGTKVVVLGSPEGLEQSISDGIISANRKEKESNKRILQFTAPVSPGSSGSPMLTLDGKVIGIVVAIQRSGQLLNWAIPVEYLKQLREAPPRASQFSMSDWEILRDDSEFSEVTSNWYALLDNLEDDEISELSDVVLSYSFGRQPELLPLLKSMSKKYRHNKLALLLYGLALRENGLLENAIDTFTEYVELDGNSGYGQYLLGELLRQRFINENESNPIGSRAYLVEAGDRLRDAVTSDPGLGAAWTELGLVYLEQEKYRPAMNAFRKSYECEDEYLRQNEETVRKLQQHDPDLKPDIRIYESYLFYGRSAEGAKDYKAAYNSYIQALSMPSADSRAYYRLAWLYEHLENYEAAGEIIIKGLIKYPQDPGLLQRAVFVSLWMNNPELARIYQRRLFSVDPESARKFESFILDTEMLLQHPHRY